MLVGMTSEPARRTCQCGADLPVGCSPRRLHCESCKKALAVQRVAAWRTVNPEKAQVLREREKPANRERATAWYEANHEAALAYRKNWRKANTEKQRIYNVTWLTKPGNRAKTRSWISAWCKAHPEKMHAYYKRWAVENADVLRDATRARARLYAAPPFTFEDWSEILELHDHRCAYCFCNDRPLTMDHVIAISRRREHSAENIVPACRPCNSKKKDRPVFLMVA